jgi:hypothetical protein
MKIKALLTQKWISTRLGTEKTLEISSPWLHRRRAVTHRLRRRRPPQTVARPPHISQVLSDSLHLSRFLSLISLGFPLSPSLGLVGWKKGKKRKRRRRRRKDGRKEERRKKGGGGPFQ